METLYNYLLYNVGNERNFLTILNVKRQMEGEIIRLYVMTRNSDFERFNLIIRPAGMPDVESAGQTLLSQYHFTDEAGVTNYLTEGKTEESTPESVSYTVSILEPADDAAGLAFPAE